MAKMMGARAVVLQKAKRGMDKVGSRAGVLKHIAKGLRSPNHVDIKSAK